MLALITGSSRGIGAATATLFAQQGYSVVVHYRRDHQAAQRVVEAISRQGGQARAMQADVSVEAEVVRLFSDIDQQCGPIDVLVNNAGMLLPQARLVDMDAHRINQILTTNVTGTFLCCREAIKRMSILKGGRGGAIVNLSSAAARLGSPGEYIDYAASKGAIDTLTLGLASEVAGEQIRVNAVRPGFIDTDIHRDGGEPDRLKRVAPSIPMKRAGRAEEVAAAILWLASEQASFVTGSLLDVAGGR